MDERPGWHRHPNGGGDDLAAEVQLRAPGHVEEYAAAEQLLRLRINEWESKR